MEFLTTPEERFTDLPDYPFDPHYYEVEASGLTMHYLDEGPADGPVVLLLHGEPSWSYLYRFMIPIVAEAGNRVIAPDLIGFGKSSKPLRIEDYTYARHCTWVGALLRALELEKITLFGQDWGSLIGLRLAAEMETRFARVMIGNGFLPTGDPPGRLLSALPNLAAFLAWRTFARYSPWFRMSKVLQMGTGRELDAGELRAYDAPFPDSRYLAGARAFPLLVPITPFDPARPDNLAAWKVLERWEKPFETAFSRGDPIMRGLDRVLQKRIPGAKDRPHDTVRGGHFLQEDSGPELARRLVKLIEETPEAG